MTPTDPSPRLHRSVTDRGRGDAHDLAAGFDQADRLGQRAFRRATPATWTRCGAARRLPPSGAAPLAGGCPHAARTRCAAQSGIHWPARKGGRRVVTTAPVSSTEVVVNRHLQCFGACDLDGIVADYATDG